MRSARTVLCLLLAVGGLAACGESDRSSQSAVAQKPADLGAAGKTARNVARQATGQTPQIVNPAEELQEFAATGLLRWSAVPGADAYEVWAYSDAGLTQAAEFSGALSSRQYQFTQLAGGQTYYVRLYFRANGAWLEAPTFTLRTTVNVVKARLSNSQEELEAFSNMGTLRWSAVAGADVYELWVYRDAQLVSFAETSGPVRITQYQITSLTPGTTYYVQVYARVNGQYTAGGALPLTVVAQQDRARIVNPQEELDAFATNGLLRWTPVTGATAYELWIFTNPNVSVIHESSGRLNARSYQVRTLQPGEVYYAQAYALVNGQWQVGAPVKITTTGAATKARLATPQEQLEAFATNGTLRWSEVPGAAAYELWIYSNAGLGKIVESGANPDRSYTTRRLCSGATYYVQVYALVNGVWTTGWATRLDVTQGTSAADCIPPSPTVSLTTSALEPFPGQAVTLNWTSQFATACTASDGWIGAKGTSGQQLVGPINANQLYTLVCAGPSGTTLAQILLTPLPPNPGYGDRHILVVHLKFSDMTDEPFPVSATEARTVTLARFFSEISYGASHQTYDIKPWASLPGSKAFYQQADPGGTRLWRDAVEFVRQNYDLAPVDIVMIALTPLDLGYPGCFQVRQPMFIDGKLQTVPVIIVAGQGGAGISCNQNTSIMSHEIGHAYGPPDAWVGGFLHSSKISCKTWARGVPPTLTDPGFNEIHCGVTSAPGAVLFAGTEYDFMGSYAGHPNVYWKRQAGWVRPRQISTVHGRASVKLDPWEIPSSGIKGIEVPLGLDARGENASYWLEYRSQRPTDLEKGTSVPGEPDRVKIWVNLANVEPETFGRNDVNHSKLFTFTEFYRDGPAATTDLAVGQTFADPYRGVRFVRGQNSLVAGVPTANVEVTVSDLRLSRGIGAYVVSGSTREFVVTNAGMRPIYQGVSSIKGRDPAVFQIVADTCAGRALPPAGSCSITVRHMRADGDTKKRFAALEWTSDDSIRPSPSVGLIGIL